MRKYAILFFILSFSASYAQSLKNDKLEYIGQSIFDVVNVPESKLDIGFWALVVAKEFDPSIDVNHYLVQLDSMTAEIFRMLAGRTKDMDKFLCVRMYLYDAGIWNKFEPYAYDLKDPLGTKIETQLLSSYIDTRRGNCVSMPTMFLTLMERVDKNVNFCGVKAPVHLFCRFSDRQTGDIWNVEATNEGSPARNQWYIDGMKISQTALDSGLYLRSLSKREYIGNLIGVLITKYRKEGDFDRALEFANLSLKLAPNSEVGLLSKGALYAEKGYKEFGNLKREEFTEEQKKIAKFYEEECNKYIDRAQELGWKQFTQKDRDEYLEKVKNKLSQGE